MENTVKLADGREATLHAFNALDGFEIKHQWIEVHENKDDVKRRKLTVRILAYVSFDDRHLNSEQVINGTLKSWLDVEQLVESCLGFNGITSQTLDDELGPKYAAMGEKLGAGFMTEVARMYGPMLAAVAERFKGNE